MLKFLYSLPIRLGPFEKRTQKLNRLIISSVFLASFSTHAAVNVDAVKMANDVGFTKCNALIKATFDNSTSAKESRTNVRYFPEKSRDNIDIDITYGSVGDTIIQSVHFSQSGGYCYASSTSIIAQEGNCAGLLNQDGHFKYVADSAGVLWSKNKGGILKMYTQTGNYCTQIYVMDNKAKI
ncbi:hypothetical protein LRS40_17630 [Leclercia sp. G3L]|uniref:hypothetical protein n=1 Tax=Leclercia sp. G3L TaxID=2898725 RepID=UPI001E4CD2A4|nr:hypothetical protein [Leclercia sp. G3L]UGB01493.1 hypothetical protein LRS40_17630 [Leclercia sp. G3L]